LMGVDFTGPDKDAISCILNRANNFREQVATIEKHLAVLESSKAMEMIADLEKQLGKIRNDSEVQAKAISKAHSAEERFKLAAATVKRVAGELVDERLAELSPLLTELYGRLKPHVDWKTVSYIMRGDVRRFLSLRIGDDLNPRFMFSNGQRRAAGLAFLLAVHLSRSWCHLNSLILDDPVQHIDDFRALHLVEVLSAIRQTGRQVICTIEDADLANLLCRRLRSVANEEGTIISLEYKPEQGVYIQHQKLIAPLPKDAILAA
jgi:chromosome segregation protein